MTSATYANASNTDAFWPYTLDNGVANNCLEQADICQGRLKLPGLWEIPMYSTFGDSQSDIHLMDPWLDSTDYAKVLEWLKFSFLTHCASSFSLCELYLEVPRLMPTTSPTQMTALVSPSASTRTRSCVPSPPSAPSSSRSSLTRGLLPPTAPRRRVPGRRRPDRDARDAAGVPRLGPVARERVDRQQRPAPRVGAQPGHERQDGRRRRAQVRGARRARRRQDLQRHPPEHGASLSLSLSRARREPLS